MVPYSFLALGDSYTIGESVAETERFPAQTVQLLRNKGIAINDAKIVATTGWTTDELEKGIREARITGTFDLVTLLIGVNNQYRGRSLEEYREQFTQLLQQAIDFAGHRPSHVVVLSIPDWGVTPFAADRDRAAIAREIDAFNAANKAIAAAQGVHWLDITAYTREAVQDASLVAADGLHPSGKDYARWAADLAALSAHILH
ncbi:SGNH/GDSL hydrolase family protein [Chitinophaga sp. G-6-1-13]|uniref:SGNH/GDSL hydrolase family protein n=1 Tax=Chitinophaga fulva TaxID=2728842 RepID=A0A848GGY3_9BACT|nr:GDSL-type esterase/lipase family protein [Chitinophaga fulva]NML37406.1 SGNH/GDSL hydrolase family protein [Chitinophaga fulva]